MENNPPSPQTERQTSCVLPVLKAFIILCVIVAVLLPWAWPGYGGFIGVVLAVLAIICSVVTLFFKAFAFGIIMALVGLFAGGVSVVGLAYHTYPYVKTTMQLQDILAKEVPEILTAKQVGDQSKVTELRLHQVELLKRFSDNEDTQKFLSENNVRKLNYIFSLAAAYAAAAEAGNEAEADAKATELDTQLNEMFRQFHHSSSTHDDVDLWDLLD